MEARPSNLRSNGIQLSDSVKNSRRGIFTRLEISKVIGGNVQSTIMPNSHPKDGGEAVPLYIAFDSMWNPYGSFAPGENGVLFIGRKFTRDPGSPEYGFEFRCDDEAMLMRDRSQEDFDIACITIEKKRKNKPPLSTNYFTTPTGGVPVFRLLRPNQWQYLGHFRLEELKPATGAEWAVLDNQVRVFQFCLVFEGT